MKEYLMKHWKGVATTVVAFGVVCSSIYYVNYVYLPGRQQAAAANSTTNEPGTSKDYNFTVNTDNAQAADSSASSSGTSTNPANDRIKVTTDKDGAVTINRTWDADPSELDTTTTAPNAPTANIGSGGGKITGTDGAYHGEQSTAVTPSTGSTTTKPSTDRSTATTKPSDSSTTPTTPSKPSTPSTPSSSTPQNGDTRVVDGQKQIYDEVFGWGADTSGGTPDSIDMPDELSGIQVGEMG